MAKQVTERDLRMPEFAEGDPSDYEFRGDGKIVRKDRWERGMSSIAAILFGARHAFEIPEVVARVRELSERDEAAKETDFFKLLDELTAAWSNAGNEPEKMARRMRARNALENAIRKIGGAA